MGLFDFFKKKVVHNNLVNELENLLKKAASDPSVMEDFYRKLLSEELFFLSDRNVMPAGKRVLESGTLVNIVSFEDGKIPIFTSTERIFDKGVIKEQVYYRSAKGKDPHSYPFVTGMLGCGVCNAL